MSLASGDQPDEANYRSLTLMTDLRTAAIAVVAPNVDPRTIRQVASRVPLGLVGQMDEPSTPNVPYVAPDPRAAGELIEHLVDLGHGSIAVLSLPQEASPTLERRGGCRSSCSSTPTRTPATRTWFEVRGHATSLIESAHAIQLSESIRLIDATAPAHDADIEP
ncbi:hypothetical protein [Microbacterium excoecariae]|uniref:hypothetical protein n=1 Tax=Microbacterium excoecariae TaxID=2715210 RepID=UPI00140E740C|nr:hypothetical protein [Microbacterium excoecariae]